ncbi:MAG: hypothetical protein ACRC3B_11015, partial [Bacteroidia bacterium]
MQLISSLEYKISGERLELLLNQINEVQKDLSITRSANVAYYQTFLEIHYYQQINQYRKASEVLTNQTELVEQHPALYNPSRLSLSYINLAWNELYLHRYANSLKYTLKASKIINHNSFNYFQLLLTEFYAYFFDGKYEIALEKIVELEQKDTGTNAEFRAGKRAYLKASAYFMLRKYKQVSQTLAIENPVDKDKEGWNLLIRILQIMNYVEMEQIENAFRAIEALRKQIDKYRKHNVNINRLSNIYEVLRGLSNSRFDFAEAIKKKETEYQNLLKSPTAKWSMFNCELIIFEQWVFAKINNLELTLNLPKTDETKIPNRTPA